MAAPLGNLNAEQWTLEIAEKLFNKAIELSKTSEYDFIGEIARDLDVYRDLFTYLAEKFEPLRKKHKIILSNLEANCFSHAKKGQIKEATAIVNLKSNYQWTDRVDNTSKGDAINQKPDLSNLTDDELRTIRALQRKCGISS
jgi:hypothetical protein